MIFPPHLTTHSDAPAMIGWSCQGNLHSLSIAAIMCAGKTDLSTRLPELLDCWQDPQIWECFRYTLFKYKIWNSSHTAFTARIFTSITHILYLSAPTWKLAATPPPPPVTVHTLLHCGVQLSVLSCSQATLLVKWNVAQKSEPACKARVYEWWKLVHSFLV